MSAVLDDSIGFDEPVNEAPVSASNDRNALTISRDMGRVQSALSEFDQVAAGLAEIEARFPKDAVYEIGTAKGMKDAVEHRAAWRDPRITVEKARKMAKSPLLALGKSIDARAAWITERLREGEEPVDTLIKVEEARREKEKQARINAEAGRILAIQEALADIGMNVLIACGKTSSEVRALSEQMHATTPEQHVFQEMIGQAREAWAAGIAKLETTLKAKLWDEAEQARIAEQVRAEADRHAKAVAAVEAQRLENLRIADEHRAAVENFAAQHRELAEKAAAIARAQKVLDDAKDAAVQAEADKAEAARIAALPPEPVVAPLPDLVRVDVKPPKAKKPAIPPDGVWLQSGGLLYMLRNGVNFCEVNVTMVKGNRDDAERESFAADLLAMFLSPEPVTA